MGESALGRDAGVRFSWRLKASRACEALTSLQDERGEDGGLEEKE